MAVYDQGNYHNDGSVPLISAVISDRPRVNGMGGRFTFGNNTETGNPIDPAQIKKAVVVLLQLLLLLLLLLPLPLLLLLLLQAHDRGEIRIKILTLDYM
jgi:hypothetical protein